MIQADLFKRPQAVHPNSLATLSQERVRLGKRATAILAYFCQQGHSLTDRDVMLGLGYNDMNAVRPRITELTDAGMLVETGGIRDSDTGKPVRLSAVTRMGREKIA